MRRKNLTQRRREGGQDSRERARSMSTARDGCATKNKRNPRTDPSCVRASHSMFRVNLKVGHRYKGE